MRTRGPDRAAALARYRALAPRYDRLGGLSARLRRRTVDLLELRRGEVVVDVGCGTGLSFRGVEERIGPEGRLIGVELSPEMAARARGRAEAHGWRNVVIVEAPAEEAELPEQPDALLSVLTHDILRSREAVTNLARQMRPGARAAVSGARWSPVLPLNVLVWLVARRYVTTFEGMRRPWGHLEAVAAELQVDAGYLGTVYFAKGRFANSP